MTIANYVEVVSQGWFCKYSGLVPLRRFVKSRGCKKAFLDTIGKAEIGRIAVEMVGENGTALVENMAGAGGL